MLRLRPYKNCDAAAILNWIKDEEAFRKWSADRYESYPITPEQLNAHYDAAKDSDSFFAFTAFDDSGVVGHLIMRFPGRDKSVLRFGFVIVDDSKRGMGYGKEMLQLALQYAFDILKVTKVTLGVFENNPAAYRCYRAVGFRDVPMEKKEQYSVMGQTWNCQELEITR